MEKKEVTIAKAFSIRKQIKKALNDMYISNLYNSYSESFQRIELEAGKGFPEKLDLENIQKEIFEKKFKDFDGNTYTQQIDKYEQLQDELEKLNIAIEESSGKQRVLLVQKTALQDKLALVESLLNKERNFKPFVESTIEKVVEETDLTNIKRYKDYKVETYSFSRYEKKDGLVFRERNLKKEINSVNDKITQLDHTEKIDVSFLSDDWA